MPGDAEASDRGMIVVALTGLRVDASSSEAARFPLADAGTVKANIRDLFQCIGAQALVCSAACGTDLLALEVANDLGMEAHVVLPFARDRFRETSVVDRPGTWDKVFDKLVDKAQRRGRLYQMAESTGSNHDAYLRAVSVILDQAVALSRLSAAYGSQDEQRSQCAAAPGSVVAVAVWDGKPRRPDDITTFFIAEAKKRAIAVYEMPT